MISDKEPVSTTTDLYQIALLIDQLKHDDRSFRINAHRNLRKIAEALGPERTRKELVPFLAACCDDDDDVLLIMAESIGGLADQVGGADQVHVLLTPLEILLSSEEFHVRDMAIQSLRIVCDVMPDIDQSIAVLRRIATKDCFPSRISAAMAIPFLYSKPSTSASTRRDLEGMFMILCEDDVPIVRRYAAMNLGVMCVKIGHLTKDCLSMLVKLTRDVQDTVRTQTVIACVDISQHFHSKDVVAKDIVPCYMALSSDKSWRIRWAAANSLDLVCQTLGPDAATHHFSSIYDCLVHDPEPEVRAIAMLKMTAIVSSFRPEVVILKFVPALHKVVSDPSEHVRVSISKSINNLATTFSKTDTIEYVLPIILLLLRDQSSEVRLNIISNLNPINEVIGVDLLSQSLLPSILNLAEDSKWRVRQSIIQIVPVLAEQLGRDFLSEKLGETCLGWLVDSVSSVRKSAADNIRKLFLLFGEEWLKDNIFPRLERMLVDRNYLRRMSALYTIEQLASMLSKSMVESTVVPILVQMSSDNVANIRMCVARLLLTLTSAPSRQSLSRLSANISALSSDKDPDVRNLAQQVVSQLR